MGKPAEGVSCGTCMKDEGGRMKDESVRGYGKPGLMQLSSARGACKDKYPRKSRFRGRVPEGWTPLAGFWIGLI